MEDVKTIQEILALFDKHQLSELALESGEFKLNLKSGKFPSVQVVQGQFAAQAPAYTALANPGMAMGDQATGNPANGAANPASANQTQVQATTAAPVEDVLASVDFEQAVDEAFEAGDREAQQKLAEQAGWTPIKSPMMGTFYAAPKPDADAFAKKGDKKKKGQVLCIIEAMKMMNELPAPADCEIKMVAVKDGQIIEYGQVIFWITKG